MARDNRPDAAGCAARERVFGDAALLERLLTELARTQPSALACLEATCRYFRNAAAPHWRAVCVGRWQATRLTGPSRADAPAWRALYRQLHAATKSAPARPVYDCGSFSFSVDVSFRGAPLAAAALGPFSADAPPEGALHRATFATPPLERDDNAASSSDEDALDDWPATPPLRAVDVKQATDSFKATLFVTRSDGAVACLLRDASGVLLNNAIVDADDAVQATLMFTTQMRAPAPCIIRGSAPQPTELIFGLSLILRAADAPAPDSDSDDEDDAARAAPAAPLFWHVRGGASAEALARPVRVRHLFAWLCDSNDERDVKCEELIGALQSLEWQQPQQPAGAHAHAPPSRATVSYQRSRRSWRQGAAVVMLRPVLARLPPCAARRRRLRAAA